MPYKSRAQAAFFHIHRKELERQGVDVDEWDAASRGMKLPKKTQHVNLGKKGSFTIKHVGALRRAAQRAGKSTSEFAHEHESDSGVLGRRSRSAIGLMHMHHGKRR